MMTVAEAASFVRKRLEVMLNIVGPVEGYFHAPTSGHCGLASWALFKALRAKGIEATVRMGRFDWSGHCWVEVAGHIIDLTGDQFDRTIPGVYCFPIDQPDCRYRLDDTETVKRASYFDYWCVPATPRTVRFLTTECSTTVLQEEDE